MFKYECVQCGICCKGDVWLRNAIRPGDVKLWQELGRDDILKYVCTCCNRLIDPEINNTPCNKLIDPEKNSAPWRKTACPFLQYENGKAKCSIHDVRPMVCREFPVRKCNKPNCSEKIHFHSWLWNGKCEASKKFRKNLVKAVESQIEISLE